MIQRELQIYLAKEKEILVRYWLPETPRRANIIFIPGLGQHSDMYYFLAQKYVAKNYAFYAIDLPGHGLSYGKRGDINCFTSCENIISELTDRVKKLDNSPVIIYGHNIGANIAACYAIDHKNTLDGIILSAPWLDSCRPLSSWVEQIGKLFLGIFPTLRFNSMQKPRKLITNAEFIDAYNQDPLRHRKISLRTYFEMKKSAAKIFYGAENLNIPALILHGTADSITAPEASRKLHRLNTNSFKLELLENVCHEIHADEYASEFNHKIFDWIYTAVISKAVKQAYEASAAF